MHRRQFTPKRGPLDGVLHRKADDPACPLRSLTAPPSAPERRYPEARDRPAQKVVLP